VNIPELQVRLTLGEDVRQGPRVGRPNVRTHGTIALLLGTASRGGSRWALMRELMAAIGDRGPYAHSIEQLRPVLRDPPSMAPAAVVVARLLVSPKEAAGLAEQAVNSYSIDPGSLEVVARATKLSGP